VDGHCRAGPCLSDEWSWDAWESEAGAAESSDDAADRRQIALQPATAAQKPTAFVPSTVGNVLMIGDKVAGMTNAAPRPIRPRRKRFGCCPMLYQLPTVTVKKEYSFCLSYDDVVPRITDERREARREQVLEAARACLEEHGLEAVSMEMIIARSGLSTGAVYGYFKSKDQLINAVVTEGMAAMAADLAPVLTNPEPPALPEFLGQVLRTAVDFGQHKGDIDRLRVSLHGWSHAQSDPELKAATRASYSGLRKLFRDVVKEWQAAGTFDAAADPEGMAELLTSITLGFVAQRALAGSADVTAHVAALEALTHRSVAGIAP
jgi:AcrR family transcriptional regulator